MFYALFNFSCNHAPPPRADPRGFAFFFSFLEVYSPPPGTYKETIPHPRAPDRPHICFLLHLQRQNDTFSQLLWMFSWVYWEKDNRCHNVAKTWTINLKTKTKKKNSLRKAPPWYNFIRTLDRIFVSPHISKAFSFKLSLFKAKLKKYFCPSFPETKIHSRTHHTHIRFKF